MYPSLSQINYFIKLGVSYMVHLESSGASVLPSTSGSKLSTALALPDGISSTESSSAVDAGIELMEQLLKVMPGMSAG